MKNLTAGLIGTLCGGVVGFFAGSICATKHAEDKIKQVQDEMNELEMYYEEQIGRLEERVGEISKKINKTYEIDGEEVSVADDMEFEEEDYDNFVKAVAPYKSDEALPADEKPLVSKRHIHPMFEDEALELIDNHKARHKEVWLFSCGTLTEGDMETPILDAGKYIGYDILNKLTDIPAPGDGDCEYPYFVHNESNSTVYEILRDNRTYKEYRGVVG